MTYPPQPGGYDPYGQQPGYTPYEQPGYAPYEQQPGYADTGPQPGYPVAVPQPGYFGPTVAEPGPRPKVVTVAAMIIVMTVLGNVGVGLLIGFEMALPTNVNEMDQGGAIAMGITSIVIGISFIAVALGVLRGRGGARVAAFVMYGISGCCGGVLTLGAAGYAFDPQEDAGAGGIFFLILSAVAFLSYVAVILLLALPTSGQWFRENAFARRAGVIR